MFIFSRLLSMSTQKRKLLEKAEDLSGEINAHLIKLLAIDDPYNEDKWRREVDKWLIAVNRPSVKGGLKIKPEELYDSLIDYLGHGSVIQELISFTSYGSGSVLVYDNWRLSCDFIPKIIDEFSKVEQGRFLTIKNLDSFKKAVNVRNLKPSSICYYDEILKWRF